MRQLGRVPFAKPKRNETVGWRQLGLVGVMKMKMKMNTLLRGMSMPVRRTLAMLHAIRGVIDPWM